MSFFWTGYEQSACHSVLSQILFYPFVCLYSSLRCVWIIRAPSTPSFQLSLLLTFVDYPSTCASTRLYLLSPDTSFTCSSSLIQFTDFFGIYVSHYCMFPPLSLSLPMSFFMSSPLLSSSSLHFCHLLSLILSRSLQLPSSRYFSNHMSLVSFQELDLA